MNKTVRNEKWECYICGKESVLQLVPGGWLGNYHPLCDSCADTVFFDTRSKFHDAMTFHYSIGDYKSCLPNNGLSQRERKILFYVLANMAQKHNGHLL